MSNVSNYASYDGIGLAELVRKGDVQPSELLEDAYEAINVINPQLNGVVSSIPIQARTTISTGLPEGPFRGVPFLVKELGVQMKGVPSQCGSKLTEGLVAEEDSELGKRFRAAGLVTAATTTTPEFGFNPSCESIFYKPTHNPWDLSRSPGGSSGGSAAMVAGGAVPLAHANDGGGSIRIPASCCGLVGLKPTRNRVPTGPFFGDWLNGLAIEFVLSRSVRDTAAMLDAVQGTDVGPPDIITPPERSYMSELQRPPEKLRIAWSDRAISGVPINSEVVSGLHETLTLLESLGHELTEDQIEIDWPHHFEALIVIWSTYLTWAIDSLANKVKRTPSLDNMERVTNELYLHGKSLTAMDMHDALANLNTVSRQSGSLFQRYDLFLTPTIAQPPLILGTLNQNEPQVDAREWTRRVFEWVPFTPLFNATGQPAISLPLHWSPENLPIGMQFATKLNDEATLIRLAAQLEEAKPWKDKRPPIFFSS